MIFELIVGLGIVCFLLIYFSYSLDNTHVIWKYFITFFILSHLVLIPKAVLDYDNNPTILTTNETVIGNSTITTTTQNAPVNVMNTARILFKSMTRLMWYFSIYVFMYLNYILWLKGFLIKNNLFGKYVKNDK